MKQSPYKYVGNVIPNKYTLKIPKQPFRSLSSSSSSSTYHFFQPPQSIRIGIGSASSTAPGVPGKPPTPGIPGNGGPGPRLEGVPGCDLGRLHPLDRNKHQGPFCFSLVEKWDFWTKVM